MRQLIQASKHPEDRDWRSSSICPRPPASSGEVRTQPQASPAVMGVLLWEPRCISTIPSPNLMQRECGHAEK